MRDDDLDEKIDIYSFGNNLYGLLTGLWVFYENDDDKVVQVSAQFHHWWLVRFLLASRSSFLHFCHREKYRQAREHSLMPDIVTIATEKENWYVPRNCSLRFPSFFSLLLSRVFPG